MATIKIQQQRITPCLWFNENAEEAVKFYTSVFKNSKKRMVTHYGEGGPMPKGSVLTVSFTINGQDFLALNGGPVFKFTEAVSFIVNCKTQKEVDYYWDKLSRGGEKGVCGWLKDKFGLSWQVVPTIVNQLLADKNAGKSSSVMQAILKMKKLDIDTLKQAYAGKGQE